MGEQGAGPRDGEPGRRPAPIERDGTPRRELAHWLRRTLTAHGEPTLDAIARRFPEDVRLSRSALAKALRGETFPDVALICAVLRSAGADDHEVAAWTAYRHHLGDLEARRRAGETVTADPPPWAAEAAPEVPRSPASPAVPVEPSRRRVPVALVAVVSLVVGAGLALGTVALVNRPRPAEPAAATILDPVTTVVPKTFRLLGNDNGLPAGTLLWATTFDFGTGRYFPQDKPCVTRDDETFDCGQYYLGRQFDPDTSRYRIDLFFADADASNDLLQYQIDKGGPDGPNPGLAALPAGTTVIGGRIYTRS